MNDETGADDSPEGVIHSLEELAAGDVDIVEHAPGPAGKASARYRYRVEDGEGDVGDVLPRVFLGEKQIYKDFSLADVVNRVSKQKEETVLNSIINLDESLCGLRAPPYFSYCYASSDGMPHVVLSASLDQNKNIKELAGLLAGAIASQIIQDASLRAGRKVRKVSA